MASKTSATSTKDLDVFIDECNRWIAFWGLTEWDVSFEHKAIEGIYAQTGVNIPARKSTITLSKIWPDGKVLESAIRDTAFHEIAELLLAVLDQMASGSWPNSDIMVEAERHAIIQRLRNCVWSRSEYVDE